MDIENDYFDKDGLVDDMVDKIIIEYDSDEMRMKIKMSCWMRTTDTSLIWHFNYHNKVKLTRQNQLQLHYKLLTQLDRHGPPLC